MAKRDPKDYAVEKTVDTIKILEALEGSRFEPVTIQQIINRVGILPDRKPGKERLKLNAVRDILITLELLGWVVRVGKTQFTIGRKFVRLAQKATFENY